MQEQEYTAIVEITKRYEIGYFSTDKTAKEDIKAVLKTEDFKSDEPISENIKILEVKKS